MLEHLPLRILIMDHKSPEHDTRTHVLKNLVLEYAVCE